MKFNTCYSPGPSEAHVKCPTQRDELQYNTSTGKIEKVGIDPFYERIQSYADACRLSTKLERYRRGDLTALGTNDSTYADISNMPNSLEEALQGGNKIGDTFQRLPDSIRGIFNDSVNEFITAVKDGTYESKVLEYAKSELAKSGGSSETPGGNTSIEGDSQAK